MGAYEFTTVADGATAREAFNRAVDDALYESGHGGYTGTIAEKGSFVVFSVEMTGVDPYELTSALGSYGWDDEGNDWGPESKSLVDDLFGANAQRAADTYNDKWGPAVCVPLPDGRWLFCGLASS